MEVTLTLQVHRGKKGECRRHAVHRDPQSRDTKSQLDLRSVLHSWDRMRQEIEQSEQLGQPRPPLSVLLRL